MIAVDEFLENQMPLRVVGQVRAADEFLKVATMVVNVPGDPNIPLGREVHDLLIPVGGDLVFFGGRAKNFRNGVGVCDHIEGYFRAESALTRGD